MNDYEKKVFLGNSIKHLIGMLDHDIMSYQTGIEYLLKIIHRIEDDLPRDRWHIILEEHEIEKAALVYCQENKVAWDKYQAELKRIRKAYE